MTGSGDKGVAGAYLLPALTKEKPAQNTSTSLLDIFGSMAGGHVELPECPAWLITSCITEPTCFRRPLEDLNEDGLA